MQLDLVTRWILLNQYRLLARLDPEAEEECNRAVEVLSSGFEAEYSNLNRSIIHEPLSDEDCGEVVDILQMHRELRHSFDGLADKADLDERAIEFRGFDGNEEGRYFSYAQFLIHDEGKWPELADAGDVPNSHMPVVETYRRMLAEWRQCREAHERTYGIDEDRLTAAELRRIVAARVHPSNR